MTSAETIKEVTRQHLKKGGVVLGQCLTAVGWVGGTVPEMREENGLIELAMSDVSNGGVAVGLALAGRRPIYIVRYQGFQWYNAAFIVNYAARSKEMWGVPCPVFIRSIGMDGSGPVTSGLHHSLFTRMPGIPVCAPMTPGEYQRAWDHFVSHDDPLCVSEHRLGFPVDCEMPDSVQDEADVTLFAISATRLNALEAAKVLKHEGVVCNVIHLFWLKPFVVTDGMKKALAASRHGGLVLDGDFEGGVVKTIAHDINEATGSPMRVLGLEERTPGYAPHLDNAAPSAGRICEFVRNIVRKPSAHQQQRLS